MNLGFRYHVASLIAVLFSLILGILIGGALFPDHILVDEQALIITELEERFRQTQTQLVSVEKQLAAAEGAWAEILASISQELLVSETVVLVETGAGFEDLPTILELAGAQVMRVKGPQLTELAATPDQVFIVSLSSDSFLGDVTSSLNELALAGSHLVYLADPKSTDFRKELPPGLLVDNIDTYPGQLALLLGIAKRSEGHYGRQEGALGLFP